MISFVILTFNSQKYLKSVLESISFADEIIIIDSGSVDNTSLIVKEFKNVKFIYQKWLGFGLQKQFGVDNATNDWVFVLDSDEIFTTELAKEVKEVLENPKFKAYKVARLNKFFGKEIKTMGLYPDYTIRLFNRKYAKFNDNLVHERVVCSHEIGVLENHFVHEAYDNISEFITKQNRYSDLNAKPNKLKAIFNPIWTFFRLFILKGGFLEGFRGFIIAKLYSQYTFWKYIK